MFEENTENSTQQGLRIELEISSNIEQSIKIERN